jgi:hypothetical protein
MPSTRSRPFFTNGNTGLTLLMIKGTCPLTASITPAPEPL